MNERVAPPPRDDNWPPALPERPEIDSGMAAALRTARVPHRGFTVAEVVRMMEAEILSPAEKFELVEGEIVPMQAKHHPHERIKLGLNRAFGRVVADEFQLGVETSLYISERTFLDPDLSIFPLSIRTHEVAASDVLLAVEVAHTTLRYDLKIKAPIYGRAGVRELWVIDADKVVTHVHRGPSPQGWTTIEILPADARLETPALPGFSIRLADLP